MADETGWICDQGCGEAPWLRGDGIGLQRLMVGEECQCGGNYVTTHIGDSAWVWAGDEAEWVWHNGLNPEERDAAVKRYLGRW